MCRAKEDIENIEIAFDRKVLMFNPVKSWYVLQPREMRTGIICGSTNENLTQECPTKDSTSRSQFERRVLMLNPVKCSDDVQPSEMRTGTIIMS